MHVAIEFDITLWGCTMWLLRFFFDVIIFIAINSYMEANMLVPKPTQTKPKTQIDERYRLRYPPDIALDHIHAMEWIKKCIEAAPKEKRVELIEGFQEFLRRIPLQETVYSKAWVEMENSYHDQHLAMFRSTMDPSVIKKQL